MSTDIIDRLHDLCDKLREKLSANSDYRALMTLERTIQELSGCLDALDVDEVGAAAVSMQHGAEHVADKLADALRDRKTSPAAAHLPSHRIA